MQPPELQRGQLTVLEQAHVGVLDAWLLGIAIFEVRTARCLSLPAGLAGLPALGAGRAHAWPRAAHSGAFGSALGVGMGGSHAVVPLTACALSPAPTRRHPRAAARPPRAVPRRFSAAASRSRSSSRVRPGSHRPSAPTTSACSPARCPRGSARRGCSPTPFSNPSRLRLRLRACPPTPRLPLERRARQMALLLPPAAAAEEAAHTPHEAAATPPAERCPPPTLRYRAFHGAPSPSARPAAAGTAGCRSSSRI